MDYWWLIMRVPVMDQWIDDWSWIHGTIHNHWIDDNHGDGTIHSIELIHQSLNWSIIDNHHWIKIRLWTLLSGLPRACPNLTQKSSLVRNIFRTSSHTSHLGQLFTSRSSLSNPGESSLVGGLEHFLFFHIMGMSTSQLTFIFFRGVETTNQRMLAWRGMGMIDSGFPFTGWLRQIPSICSCSTLWLHGWKNGNSIVVENELKDILNMTICLFSPYFWGLEQCLLCFEIQFFHI